MTPTIPDQQSNPAGLHRRYNITKANGDPVDPEALYFVLRLDDGGDDEMHLEACREAARAYCRYIFGFKENVALRTVADELWQLVNDIEATEPM